MEPKSRYDNIISRIKNNKILFIILLASTSIIWVGNNIEAAEKILGLFSTRKSENTIPPPPVDASRNIQTNETKKDSTIVRHVKKNEAESKSGQAIETLYDVNVLSEPEELDIYIDDKFMGKTNRTLKLTEGQHEIKVMSDPVYKDIINVPAQEIITIKQDKKNKS